MKHISIPYLSEPEASALRWAYSGGRWEIGINDMTIVVENFRIPQNIAMRFINDWRRSGQWTLWGCYGPPRWAVSREAGK